MNHSVESVSIKQTELTISAWGSALSQLAAASGLSEEIVIDAARKGAVWCKPEQSHKLRRIRDLQNDAAVNDTLYFNYNATVLAKKALTPLLVAKEINYSVWNKPAGMLSQGSKWSDHCTITETVKEQLDQPCFLVHRLDRAASGLIVVAHTKNALKKLTELFAQRQVLKHYQVKVHGQLTEKLPLRLQADVQNKTALTTVVESKCDQASDTSDLLVSIETGRKHQIRDHLYGVGFPVVGDRLFDAAREHEQDLCLRASMLAFECPFTHVQKSFEI